MGVMAPSPPLVVKIWSAFSLNFVHGLSLQTSFERVVDYGFHQRFTAMRRGQVCISQKEDV